MVEEAQTEVMMNRLIPLMLLIWLLPGCSNHSFEVIKKFPVENSIGPVKTIEYDVVNYPIWEIAEIGDFYLLSLFSDTGFGFAVTDKSFNQISRLCRLGNGPGEFLSTEFRGLISVSEDTLRFYVHDLLKGRRCIAAVCLKSGKSKITETDSFAPWTRAYYPLGNGKYLISNNNNRYYLTDNSGNKTYFEGWGDDINEAVENQEWYIPDIQSTETFNSDSSRLLINDRNSPALWVHSTDGTLVKNVYIGKGPEDLDRDTYRGGHLGASYLGDDSIVTMYVESDDMGETDSSWLLIFDKDLNPKARLSLQGENKGFTLNRKTGILLMLGYDYEEIRVYDLSEWL